MSEARVRDVMSREVIAVQPADALEKVASKMRLLKVSGFPVVSEFGALEGVVTERDLGRGLSRRGLGAGPPASFLDLLAHGAPMEDQETLAVLRGRLRQMHVDAVMSRQVTTVGPDTSVREAGRLLAERGLHRLPVVDKGIVVGVVSFRDVLRGLCFETRPADLAP